MEIALTPADVAGLPGAGHVQFEGAAEGLAPELFAHGVKRIVDYYVMGMHAEYGLSNFAPPKPFLLLLRQLTDDLYAAISDGPVADASPGNAEMEPIIRALYPAAPSSVPPVPAPQNARTDAAAPVIVVGFPRSGTTWLQRMLQAHPDLAGPEGETCLFTSLRDVLANDALMGLAGRAAVVAAVRRFARALFAYWQEHNAPDALRVVEKTPSNVDHLETIVELFPEASIIGIYRDGRDVVHSLMQVQFGTDDPTAAAKGWVRSFRKLQAFAAGSDRIRVVRYEELLSDPTAHVVELLAWLGLPVDDRVRAALEAQAGTRVSQHQVRHSEGLSPAEAYAVYRHGGELLVELGYATPQEVRAVKLRPGYTFQLVRRRAGRLMRNR